MRNVIAGQIIAGQILGGLLGAALGLSLAGAPAWADPAEAVALFGAWCDETGYRLDLSATEITFTDRQAPHPPPGQELAFGGNIAVYIQDFRDTLWPEIDVVACTLTLTGPDSAAERCEGPGTGFNRYIELRRCQAAPIS